MSEKRPSSPREPTLVYGFDPICGWCFGFRSAVASLRKSLAGRVSWRLASGGLVTGERITPIGETRDYLVRGMAMVEARTDARFGAGFTKGLLAQGTWVSTSEPGCRAVLLVQRLEGSEKALKPPSCSRPTDSQSAASSSMFRCPEGVTEEACLTMPFGSMMMVARSVIPLSAR